MQIVIGRTRSGREIAVPVALEAGAHVLVRQFTEPADRMDVYCVLSYLRSREGSGWLLTAFDNGERFERLLRDLLEEPEWEASINESRAGAAATVFDHLKAGRDLVLAAFRS